MFQKGLIEYCIDGKANRFFESDLMDAVQTRAKVKNLSFVDSLSVITTEVINIQSCLLSEGNLIFINPTGIGYISIGRDYKGHDMEI